MSFDSSSLVSANSLKDILGGLSNPFGTPSDGEWNLQRGVVTDSVKRDGSGKPLQTVFFFEKSDDDPLMKTAIDTATDTGGRRLAVYEYAYKDGQRIRDLGRKGEKFVLNIKFFGLNYSQKFGEFIENVAGSPNQLNLTHPVRGSINVRFQEYEYLHRYDEWNAVTIRATFLEDNAGLASLGGGITSASKDTAIRNALQKLSDNQKALQNTLFNLESFTKIPTAVKAGIQARIDSISGSYSRLIGQLAVTFGQNNDINELAAQAGPIVITSMNSGTVVDPVTKSSKTLPPTFQVGYDEATITALNLQTDNFSKSNQITPQQAVYSANAIRSEISAAINEVKLSLENYSYDIIYLYRDLAVSIQEATETAISQVQQKIKYYVTPRPMSLRMVCALNSLSYDRQNDVESMNPGIPCLNYIAAGVSIKVPTA